MIVQSCISDSEIRALYTNRPCPQDIVMNTEVRCVQSAPCAFTSETKENITFEKDLLEKQIVFDKKPLKDCPYTRSLADIKWEPAIYFDYKKYALSPRAQNQLDNNIRFLSNYSRLSCIAIRGFTDNRGNHAYNQRLANNRAISTMTYLQKQGIEKNRIVLSPVGETAPLLPNNTNENMSINRRVEMLLLDMSGQPVPYVILTKDMKTLVNRDLDKHAFCKIWDKRVLWYPGIFFQESQNRINTPEELKKLESNICVLKANPEFMISIREFSSNHANADHTRNAFERIQYIAKLLYQHNIDKNRIQLVPPEETLIVQSNFTGISILPFVELLLLDHRARPFSVIVTLDQ